MKTTIAVESHQRRGDIRELADTPAGRAPPRRDAHLPGGTRTSDEVVFAEAGDMVLLGAHTIEGLNLRVDLESRQLVPAGPVPAALTRSAA